MAAAEPQTPSATKDKKPSIWSKEVTFEFDNAPWEEVIRWFSQETSLAFSSTEKPPAGKFSFSPEKGPDGKPRKYTLREAREIINDALEDKNYILVSREGYFTLLDAKNRDEQAHSIGVEELENRSGRELVKVVVKTEGENVKELAAKIRPIMGKHAAAIAVEKSNQLVLADRADSLRVIVQLLKPCNGNEFAALTPKRIKARLAEEMLIDVFGPAMKRPSPLKPVLPRQRPPLFAVNERSNTVFIRGTAEAITKAKKFIEEIDKPLK